MLCHYLHLGLVFSVVSATAIVQNQYDSVSTTWTKSDATGTLTEAVVKPTDWATNSKYACSPQVDGLVAGIEINILAQHAELNATEDLQTIEAAKSINATAFAAGKAVLLSDIAFGIIIREFNQKLTPPGNAVIPGLTKVRYRPILFQP